MSTTQNRLIKGRNVGETERATENRRQVEAVKSDMGAIKA